MNAPKHPLKGHILPEDTALLAPSNSVQGAPINLFLHPHGTLDNKESFTFHIETGIHYPDVLAQVSLKMLNDALNECGYQITPKP